MSKGKRYTKRFGEWDDDDDYLSHKKDNKRYDLKKEWVKEQREQKAKQKNSFFDSHDT
jgi:hypothetical protein